MLYASASDMVSCHTDVGRDTTSLDAVDSAEKQGRASGLGLL